MHYTRISLLLLAAVSCSNESLLGISEVYRDHATGAKLTQAAAPHTTVFRGDGNDRPWLRRPSLGDVDGDGLDDLIVEASWTDGDAGYGNRAYLFYGRPTLPAQLSTADADAVFDTGEQPTNALGDINGDGLADFALGDWDGFEIVLGSKARLSGAHKRYETGLAWRAAPAGASLLYLRALGDVNGDGADELHTTIISQAASGDGSRVREVFTDYVIAGRRDGWPSGSWDPAWAAAQLGDEQAPEVQRLRLVDAADLDGDGYVDILALGSERLWVFYGSDKGLQGTLTPAEADASLSWRVEPGASGEELSKALAFVVGDVDSDGCADIAVPHQTELGIVYGAKRRWSGHVQLEPDLTLVRPTTELSRWYALANDPSYVLTLPEVAAAVIYVGVADLDGDGKRELVLHDHRLAFDTAPYGETISALYALKAPALHAMGQYKISDADLYKADAISDAPTALARGLLLDPGGDFDGDGSTDLMFGVAQDTTVVDPKVELHLLPGAPHAPD